MSVLHQNSGSIGKSIPDGQEIFAEPRKISRLWISQCLQSFAGVQTFSHHQSFPRVLKSILPC